MLFLSYQSQEEKNGGGGYCGRNTREWKWRADGGGEYHMGDWPDETDICQDLKLPD